MVFVRCEASRDTAEVAAHREYARHTMNSSPPVLLFLSLVSSQACGAACWVVADDPHKGRYVVEPGNRTFNNTEFFEDCKQVKRVTGSPLVCYENDVAQAVCMKLGEGNPSSPEITPSVGSSVWVTIAELLSGTARPRPTGKGLKDTKKLPGFPYGRVLLPVQHLEIWSEPVLQSGFHRFVLKEKGGGKSVIEHNHIKDRVRVPKNTLRRGTKYKWSAKTGQGDFKGEFSIVKDAEEVEFETFVSDSLATSDRSPFTRNLIKAYWCQQFGFQFDRDHAIRDAHEETR